MSSANSDLIYQRLSHDMWGGLERDWELLDICCDVRRVTDRVSVR